VVIVTADHGEALHEHGWIGHNVQVYDESVHIPLIVRFPKDRGPAGVRIPGLVDLLDLGPTIADLFGVLGRGGSDESFEGRSLLPVIAGAPGKPAVLSRTIWDRPRYALRTETEKFIYDSRSGEETLFDLAKDPGETKDVRDADPLRAAYYRETLHTTVARLARRSGSAAVSERRFTAEQCENMNALGYVQAGCEDP
jgi:arylsulfatase A-like enzyme